MLKLSLFRKKRSVVLLTEAAIFNGSNLGASRLATVWSRVGCSLEGPLSEVDLFHCVVKCVVQFSVSAAH